MTEANAGEVLNQLKSLNEVNLNIKLPTSTIPNIPKATRHTNQAQFSGAKEFNMKETGGGKHVRPYPPDTHGNPYPTVDYTSSHSPSGKHAKPYDTRADVNRTYTQRNIKVKAIKATSRHSTVQPQPKFTTVQASQYQGRHRVGSPAGVPFVFGTPKPIQQKTISGGKRASGNKNTGNRGHQNKHTNRPILQPSKHAGKLAETLRQVTKAA